IVIEGVHYYPTTPNVCSYLGNICKPLIFHFGQLAFHNFKLSVGGFGLPIGIEGQGQSQQSNSSGRSGGNNAIMPIKTFYEASERTVDKALSVVRSIAIIAIGYFLLTWGGGAFLSWRNPIGLIGGL